MPNDATTYRCFVCEKDIIDHVYLVQRRRVRPLRELLPDGTMQENQADLLNPFHSGIQVGPEQDPYCDTCFAKLSSIQELINDYKNSLDSTGQDLG